MVNCLRTVTVLGLAVLAGCAAPTVRQYFVDYALDRAVFEMKCPKNDLQIVQLSTPLEQTMRPGAQVGLKGCGQQTVYVFVRNTGWILDSASGPDQSAAK